MKPIKKHIRLNGETNLIHTREDIKTLMEYCNFLADTINQLIEENNKLKRDMEYVKGAVWRE